MALAVSNQIPCEIYTDVDGVYATDPRLLPKAKRLDIVSYEEMMEMSALGAGVLETRSIELAKTIISLIFRKNFIERERNMDYVK